jgi:hypothetical protein
VSFDAITLCVASQWVFIVVSVYFVIDSVRKILVTPLYVHKEKIWGRVEYTRKKRKRICRETGRVQKGCQNRQMENGKHILLVYSETKLRRLHFKCQELFIYREEITYNISSCNHRFH